MSITTTTIGGTTATTLKRRDLGDEVAVVMRATVTATGDKVNGEGEVTPTATIKATDDVFLDDDLFDLVAKYARRAAAAADDRAGRRRLDFDEEAEAHDLEQLLAEARRLDADVTREERGLAVENLARSVVAEVRTGAVRSAHVMAQRLAETLADLIEAIAEADKAAADAKAAEAAEVKATAVEADTPTPKAKRAAKAAADG